MSKPLVPDELWALVEPLLPKHPYVPGVGKPRVPDRVCLSGIVFVLKTGLPWEDFPQEMGCCGMTLWNRLNEWRQAGVWDQLHRLLLDKLRGAGEIHPCGAQGKKTGPSPVDRRKNGSKHPLAVDAGGVPLATLLTGANRHDVTQLIPLIDAIPPIGGKVGAPLRKPGEVMADRGYDSDPHRMQLSGRGSGLGTFRYFVEQTIALLHQFRRLRTRFDKRDDIHEAFMTLGCAMICWRRLHSSISYF
jgi:transposase